MVDRWLLPHPHPHVTSSSIEHGMEAAEPEENDEDASPAFSSGSSFWQQILLHPFLLTREPAATRIRQILPFLLAGSGR